MSPSRRAALSVLAIVAFAALFFAPELFGNRRVSTANMARWLPWAASASAEERAAPSHNPDCNLSYYPRRAVMHDAWQRGVIPYWNPYSFCGAPFWGDPQSGVLYPPNWLLVPFDPGRQLGYFLFLHVAWGGIGIWLLARRFTSRASLAVAAGCAFAVNGYFAKHFGQPVFLAAASWIPWLLALGLALLDRPTWRRAGLLGLAGALTFLAGQPQTAFHATYAVALVLALTWLSRPSETRAPLVRVLVLLVGAVGVAGLLVSAQLLPTLDLVRHSARASLPLSTVLSGSFHPVDVIRFVIPEFFGTPLTGDEWSMLFPRGDGFYPRNQLNSIFAGSPVFVLALWGMLGPRTRRDALPFTVLFFFGVLVAFGSPLAALVYDWLPGFRFSRIDRIGALVIVAQFVPAILGAGDLIRAGGSGRRWYGAAWIAVAVALLVTVVLRGSSLVALLGSPFASAPDAMLDATRVQLLTSRALLALGWTALSAVAFLGPARPWSFALPLGAALVQLVMFASPYRTDRRAEDVFRATPSIGRLADLLNRNAAQGGYRFVRFGRDLPVQPYPLSSVLPPSTNVPFHLRDLQGYNALSDRALGEALETALDENVFSHGIWSGRRIVAPTEARSLENPLLAALSVGVAVSGRPFHARGWDGVEEPDFAVAANRAALPRVRFASSGRGVGAPALAAILRDGAFDPRDAIWIGEGDVPAAPAADSAFVEVLTDSWNEMTVRVRTNVERVLVISDSFSSGWQATVDAEPAEILAIFGIVRGIRVPAGAHRIEMRYHPPGLRLGSALSLVGLLVSGALISLGSGGGNLVKSPGVF